MPDSTQNPWKPVELETGTEQTGDPQKDEKASPLRDEIPMWSVILLFCLMFLFPFLLSWLASTSLSAIVAEGIAQSEREQSERESRPVPNRIAAPSPEGSAVSRSNPAEVLVGKIVSEEFYLREEVTTGRFLGDFERNVDRLYEVDTERDRLVRRGRNWVETEAPWEPEGEDESSKTARLRFVKRENTWKLENLRILKEPFGD